MRGDITVRNANFKEDFEPVEEGCDCYCCEITARLKYVTYQYDEIFGGRRSPFITFLSYAAYFQD
jgi:tRNA-guanine family transglycosylase